MSKADRFLPLLIATVFASPILAGWWAHGNWHPGLTNYGELLTPDRPSPANLKDPGGRPVDLTALHGKWLLVTVAAGPCTEACSNNLHLAHQVILALGGDRSRLKRLLISGDAAGPTDDPGLSRLVAVNAGLTHLTGATDSRIYLLDPLGRAVLRFPEQPDGMGMLRDLRRLLAASRIG